MDSAVYHFHNLHYMTVCIGHKPKRKITPSQNIQNDWNSLGLMNEGGLILKIQVLLYMACVTSQCHLCILVRWIEEK
jgi:hypothetical protein